MTNNYSHLSLDERIKIEVFLDHGSTLAGVAGFVGRHRSTISREVKRARRSGFNRYIANFARASAARGAPARARGHRLPHARLRPADDARGRGRERTPGHRSAEFFVHRHVYGKWTCRCCQRQGIERLVQKPADPQIIDGGIAASGFAAHILISRFVDHLPYYRQETINARSGVHTPRSTLARTAGNAGAAMEPLFEAHKRFVLSGPVLHADETPVSMLDPGAGKTKRAYIWAYARGELDAQRGVIYEFCLGRGSQYPVAFLGTAQGPPGSATQDQPAWQGTLVCDQYVGYDAVLDKRVYPQRIAAHCVAHARRKFDELLGTSEVAKAAIKRIGWIYHVEGQFDGMDAQQRQAAREQFTRPLWKELHIWLKLERSRVPDGGSIAAAIDYSLNSWTALTRHLEDGAVPIDNNFIERQIKPWAMGRKAWLFCGSKLAGQRAAIVMSLVQSAKLNGHDPWAYLRDVLERLPSHPNSRIEELLPHRWQKPAA